MAVYLVCSVWVMAISMKTKPLLPYSMNVGKIKQSGFHAMAVSTLHEENRQKISIFNWNCFDLFLQKLPPVISVAIILSHRYIFTCYVVARQKNNSSNVRRPQRPQRSLLKARETVKKQLSSPALVLKSHFQISKYSQLTENHDFFLRVMYLVMQTWIFKVSKLYNMFQVLFSEGEHHLFHCPNRSTIK